MSYIDSSTHALARGSYAPTFSPERAVNTSSWLDHDMVLDAIRNDRDGERLSRYATEARLQRATGLAAELQTLAGERAAMVTR